MEEKDKNIDYNMLINLIKKEQSKNNPNKLINTDSNIELNKSESKEKEIPKIEITSNKRKINTSETKTLNKNNSSKNKKESDKNDFLDVNFDIDDDILNKITDGAKSKKDKEIKNGENNNAENKNVPNKKLKIEEKNKYENHEIINENIPIEKEKKSSIIQRNFTLGNNEVISDTKNSKENDNVNKIKNNQTYLNKDNINKEDKVKKEISDKLTKNENNKVENKDIVNVIDNNDNTKISENHKIFQNNYNKDDDLVIKKMNFLKNEKIKSNRSLKSSKFPKNPFLKDLRLFDYKLNLKDDKIKILYKIKQVTIISNRCINSYFNNYKKFKNKLLTNVFLESPQSIKSKEEIKKASIMYSDILSNDILKSKKIDKLKENAMFKIRINNERKDISKIISNIKEENEINDEDEGHNNKINEVKEFKDVDYVNLNNKYNSNTLTGKYSVFNNIQRVDDFYNQLNKIKKNSIIASASKEKVINKKKVTLFKQESMRKSFEIKEFNKYTENVAMRFDIKNKYRELLNDKSNLNEFEFNVKFPINNLDSKWVPKSSMRFLEYSNLDLFLENVKKIKEIGILENKMITMPHFSQRNLKIYFEALNSMNYNGDDIENSDYFDNKINFDTLNFTSKQNKDRLKAYFSNKQIIYRIDQFKKSGLCYLEIKNYLISFHNNLYNKDNFLFSNLVKKNNLLDHTDSHDEYINNSKENSFKVDISKEKLIYRELNKNNNTLSKNENNIQSNSPSTIRYKEEKSSENFEYVNSFSNNKNSNNSFNNDFNEKEINNDITNTHNDENYNNNVYNNYSNTNNSNTNQIDRNIINMMIPNCMNKKLINDNSIAFIIVNILLTFRNWIEFFYELNDVFRETIELFFASPINLTDECFNFKKIKEYEINKIYLREFDQKTLIPKADLIGENIKHKDFLSFIGLFEDAINTDIEIFNTLMLETKIPGSILYDRVCFSLFCLNHSDVDYISGFKSKSTEGYLNILKSEKLYFHLKDLLLSIQFTTFHFFIGRNNDYYIFMNEGLNLKVLKGKLNDLKMYLINTEEIKQIYPNLKTFEILKLHNFINFQVNGYTTIFRCNAEKTFKYKSLINLYQLNKEINQKEVLKEVSFIKDNAT